MKPLIQVFFAIPCGIFYENQQKIIIKICESYNIEPIINENDPITDSLLSQICNKITNCELFVADISSNSPNVIFELGYAFRAKPRSKIAILLSNISKCPSDLQDIKRLQYGNYREFAEKLNEWLSQFFNSKILLDDTFKPYTNYYETFQDCDSFIKRWDFPLGCDYSLTFNGFRFSNAHFPIISKHLAYLDNYIFEFECSIERNIIGWIINGTKYKYEDNIIDFCVMFNLNIDGHLTPHIFSKQYINPNIHYQVFDRIKINYPIDYTKRLKIKTKVINSKAKVFVNDFLCFDQDFNEMPYATYYNSVKPKTNQIGFRCHPGEEATIYSIKVDPIIFKKASARRKHIITDK